MIGKLDTFNVNNVFWLVSLRMVHITLTNQSCGMDETILYPPSPCGEVSIVIEVIFVFVHLLF